MAEDLFTKLKRLAGKFTGADDDADDLLEKRIIDELLIAKSRPEPADWLGGPEVDDPNEDAAADPASWVGYVDRKEAELADRDRSAHPEADSDPDSVTDKVDKKTPKKRRRREE